MNPEQAGELSRHDELHMLAVRLQGTMNRLLRLLTEEIRENGNADFTFDSFDAGATDADTSLQPPKGST